MHCGISLSTKRTKKAGIVGKYGDMETARFPIAEMTRGHVNKRIDALIKELDQAHQFFYQPGLEFFPL